VAGRLGARIGRGIVATLGVIAIAALWQLAFGDDPVEPRLVPPTATATIGEGSEAIAVGPDGAILAWLSLPEGIQLPRLPISEPPPKGELGGEVLEQARVLGAAQSALRPYIERSRYSENGVAVELRGGIELRFGDATRLRQKWEAAAAVLADPTITDLGYVNLQDPRHPAIGGSGHALPALP
jgi:hypothetical protein